MVSFAKTLLLSLALTCGASARDFNPSVNVNVHHDKLGNGMRVDSIRGDVSIESQLNDDLTVGADLEHGADSPIKSIFARMSQKFGSGHVNADLSVGLADNSVSGDVAYYEGDNEVLARVNSNDDDFVESVQFTRKGDGWMFRPTWNVKDSNFDLEAETDINDKTHINVKVSQGGDAQMKLNHKMDDSTNVRVTTDVQNTQVEVERSLDDSNTLRPKFDLASKHLTCAWVRKLDGGRTLTANVDPDNSVDFELEDGGDWSARLSAPWSSPRDADVSFGKKFSF